MEAERVTSGSPHWDGRGPSSELDSDLPLPSNHRRTRGGLLSAQLSTLERARMKAPWTDPALRELLALAALAAFGFGMALAHGDFLFLAIFAAATAFIIVAALRRSR